MRIIRHLIWGMVAASIIFGGFLVAPSVSLESEGALVWGAPAASAAACECTQALNQQTNFCLTWCGLIQTAQKAKFPDAGTEGKNPPEIKPQERIAQLVGLVLNPLLALLGVVFSVLVIISGLRWMLSGGAEEKIKSAQKMLVAAFVGLLITIGSYMIVYFVFENVIKNL